MARRSANRRGISMIETTIATLLVGLVLASTIGLLAPVMRSTQHTENELVAQRLADEMVQEITNAAFEEPDETAGTGLLDWLLNFNDNDDLDAIGTDSGERTSVRADFDDVDDFNGWVAKPPQSKSGDVYSELAAWGRQVSVEHISMSDFTTTSADRTGAKRITIRVVFNGTELARETIIRTASWDASRRTEE